MTIVLRSVYAIIASLAFAVVSIVGVELVSNVVHPFPPEFSGTQAEVCQHVARYPHWVLALVVAAWGTITLESTWIATRMGSRVHGIIIGVLLLSAVGFNLSMLPYPIWFKVLNLCVFPLAIFLGIRSSQGKPNRAKPIQSNGSGYQDADDG